MMDKKFCGSGSFVFPLPLDYIILYVMQKCNAFYMNFLSFLIIFIYAMHIKTQQDYNGVTFSPINGKTKSTTRIYIKGFASYAPGGACFIAFVCNDL